MESPSSSAFSIIFDEAINSLPSIHKHSKSASVLPGFRKQGKGQTHRVVRGSPSLPSPTPDGFSRATMITQLVEETSNKSKTVRPFQKLMTNCADLQGSVVDSWKAASINITKSRSSFSSLSLKVGGERRKTTWNQGPSYLTGKNKINAVLALKSDEKISKDLKVARALLETQQADEHVYLTLKDLSTKNTIDYLRLNRRSFGSKKNKAFIVSERTSPKQSGCASPRRRNSMDELLLDEIEEYRKEKVPDVILELDKLPQKFRALAVQEQEKLFKEIGHMSPLNQLVLNHSKKYMPRLRSQLNFRRNSQLAAKMNKIHPSPEVIQKAVALMLSRTPNARPQDSLMELIQKDYDPIDFKHKMKMESLLRKRFRGAKL
jgi:hypothetical protein